MGRGMGWGSRGQEGHSLRPGPSCPMHESLPVTRRSSHPCGREDHRIPTSALRPSKLAAPPTRQEATSCTPPGLQVPTPPGEGRSGDSREPSPAPTRSPSFPTGARCSAGCKRKETPRLPFPTQPLLEQTLMKRLLQAELRLRSSKQRMKSVSALLPGAHGGQGSNTEHDG